MVYLYEYKPLQYTAGAESDYHVFWTLALERLTLNRCIGHSGKGPLPTEKETRRVPGGLTSGEEKNTRLEL